MVCSHVQVNVSMMIGAVLSWGLAWPLLKNRAGDWYPTGLASHSFRGLFACEQPAPCRVPSFPDCVCFAVGQPVCFAPSPVIILLWTGLALSSPACHLCVPTITKASHSGIAPQW